MNTYRVYALDTTVALEPTVIIAYVRAEKYGPAWELARAVLAGKVKPALYADAEATKLAAFPKGCVVAKIVDIRPRNVKLDVVALKAVLADPKATDAEKLEAARALVG